MKEEEEKKNGTDCGEEQEEEAEPWGSLARRTRAMPRMADGLLFELLRQLLDIPPEGVCVA